VPIQKRSITGLKPTGQPHLGNLFGGILPNIQVPPGTQRLYFIANLHSLTAERDAKTLMNQTYDMAATSLALGLDPQKIIFFKQSDIPEVSELTWILSCFTSMGLLERAHAYKDARVKKKEVNNGIFTYPVLMAADILLYDVDQVPVGKDQKQHVEMVRDIAGSFNHAYGAEIFKLPEPVIDDRVMTIPGLDGQKMSKSYNNTIGIFEPENQLKKKVMSIPTDSTPLEEPKKAEGTLVFELYCLFAKQAQTEDYKKRLAAGGMGWGHAKEELFEMINSYIRPYRKPYESWIQNRKGIDQVLRDGAVQARDIAKAKMSLVRKTLGIN
jgi:tryptophanyl-tRNA synthetase